jgi:hypothetical protein
VPQPPVDALALLLCRPNIITADCIDRQPMMLVEQDLFGKLASTFPDHALAALLCFRLELGLQRRKLSKRRVRIGRLLAAFVSLMPLVPRHMGGRPLAFTTRTVKPLIRPMPASMARMPFRLRGLGRNLPGGRSLLGWQCRTV